MTSSLQQLRRSRALTIALVAVWLPYITTRCFHDPAAKEDCHVLQVAAETHTHDEANNSGGRGHTHSADEHSDHHNNRSAHTCCELTGKCTVKASSEAPSLSPVVLVGPLPPAVRAHLPRLAPLRHRSGAAMAHGPPLFLRLASLLI